MAEPLMPMETDALAPTFMVALYGLWCFLASISADILWWSVRDRTVDASAFYTLLVVYDSGGDCAVNRVFVQPPSASRSSGVQLMLTPRSLQMAQCIHSNPGRFHASLEAAGFDSPMGLLREADHHYSARRMQQPERCALELLRPHRSHFPSARTHFLTTY